MFLYLCRCIYGMYFYSISEYYTVFYQINVPAWINALRFFTLNGHNSVKLINRSQSNFQHWFLRCCSVHPVSFIEIRHGKGLVSCLRARRIYSANSSIIFSILINLHLSCPSKEESWWSPFFVHYMAVSYK